MKTTNQISDDLSALSETSNEVLKQKRDSILGKLPEYIKDYIEECFKYKRIPKEYQLASILYSIATASGSTFFTNQMNYTNYSNIYIMIFGNRSDGKSEGIKMATKELVKQDDKYYEDYEVEKLNNDEKHKPILKQILVKDSSIEALKLNHYKCPNGIGIMIDEIRSLLINMNSNNSRDGKEYLSFLLDSFTNSNISSLTKSTESFRLKKSCCSLIGGLQKQFLGILFTPKLLSSGFVDRLLCVNLIEANNKLSKLKISSEKVNRYNQTISNILEYKVQSEKPEEENKRFEIRFTNEAQDKLFEFSQKIEDMKEKSKSPLKEYLGKSSIYLHKLCIVVFLINRAEKKYFKKHLEATEVDLAFELVEFFILNFKRIIKTSKERQVSKEDIIWLAKQNDAKQKAVVEITGYSKSQVSKIWNRI